jgi:hypothetical protein
VPLECWNMLRDQAGEHLLIGKPHRSKRAVYLDPRICSPTDISATSIAVLGRPAVLLPRVALKLSRNFRFWFFEFSPIFDFRFCEKNVILRSQICAPRETYTCRK